MHGNMKKFEWKRGYLHGQTGRSTVWADGTQNSGLVNFVPESRLLPKKNGREGLNPVSKMALTNGTRNSVRKNRTTFSDVPLLPEIFSGTTQKVVRHLLSKRIFWKILVNGKQTVISIAITWQKTKHTKGCRVQHEDFSPQTMASKGFTLIGPWCSLIPSGLR